MNTARSSRFAESPVTQGIYWAGTNDGAIQVSRDGGYTWTEVGKNLPGGGTKEYHISGLEASWLRRGDGVRGARRHYAGDMQPYCLQDNRLRQDLDEHQRQPAEGQRRTRSGRIRRTGACSTRRRVRFFVSLERGRARGTKFMPGLPAGRIDEVLVHPRDNDLIVAHHGRGVWIMDDISALQQLTPTRWKRRAHAACGRAKR
jgi:hypothetical protein